MLGFLRIIRIFCGVIFAMQIAGLLPIFTWLQQPSAIPAGMWVLVAMKISAMVLFGWLFFALRSLINRLHTKTHGIPHPALAEKKWAL